MELPGFNPQGIIVISLSLPTKEGTEERLENELQKAISTSYTGPAPSLECVPCVDSVDQAQNERDYTAGSTAHLFFTASQASKKGWNQFAVADDLTIRRLEDRLRPYDKDTLSLILIQICETEQSNPHLPSGRHEGSKVFAKRYPFERAISMLVRRESIQITPLAAQKEQCSPSLDWSVYDAYGMVIHNLERSLFQLDFGVDVIRKEMTSTTLKALSLKPFLPEETKLAIVTGIRQEMTLDEMTDASILPNNKMKTMEVHALSPIPNLKSVANRLNDCTKAEDPQMDVNLYAWKGNLPANRHQFWRLWCRTVHWHRSPHIFTAYFLDATSAETCNSLIVALWHNHHPATICRIPISHAVRFWKRKFFETVEEGCRPSWTQDRNFLLEDKILDLEMLYGPNKRLFNDWMPWSHMFGHIHGKVYFLTKAPGEQAIQDLKKEMCDNVRRIAEEVEERKNKDFRHPYMFHPWQQQEDGNRDDMVRFAADIYCNEGEWFALRYVAFVSRQIFDDKLVTFSKYEHVDPDGAMTDNEKVENYKEGNSPPKFKTPEDELMFVEVVAVTRIQLGYPFYQIRDESGKLHKGGAWIAEDSLSMTRGRPLNSAGGKASW